MSQQQNAVVKTEQGDSTPFEMQGFAIQDTALKIVRERIEVAMLAKPESFTDITPIYWEAKRGEQKTMFFLGWKQANKKDDKGEVIGQKFIPVFHDGNRQVVMSQIAAVEAMMGKPVNEVYRITCDESAAGKAKKFTVEHFNA